MDRDVVFIKLIVDRAEGLSPPVEDWILKRDIRY